MSDDEIVAGIVGMVMTMTCIILMVVSLAIGDPKVTMAIIMGQSLIIVMGAAFFIEMGLNA